MRATMARSFKKIKPPPPLTVSEWANQYRYLSPESAGNEAGKFNTDRAPYQKGMMDAASDPAVETITIMSAARIGKTEGIIQNVLGYHIHQDPSSSLTILPTFLLAKDWSKINVAPMVRDTPVLRKLVSDPRSKDGSNEILYKTFPGGYAIFAGANSPTSLSLLTVRLVNFDEIDQYPPSAGTEGDPLALGRVRASTYWNRKYIQTSTPTIKELSRIEAEFQRSSQQFFRVPCPFCKHRQILIFGPSSQFTKLAKGFLQFDKANLSWIHYQCENCKKPIDEKYKMQMLRGGRWEPEMPMIRDHAGFHLSALYSPFCTWAEIIKQWLDATQRQAHDELKVWVNKKLGETWEETKSIRIDEVGLAERREAYISAPAGVLVFTAGVDVQTDRLEVVVKGWGVNEESWFIQRRILYGSPELKDVWKLLEDFLDTPLELAGGLYRKIAGVCIDSSYCTEKVYDFCRRHRGRRVFATKGRAGWKLDIVGKVKRHDRGANFFIIGADVAKDKVYDRLAIEKPGPCYMHFNGDCDEDYFSQLSSEKLTIKKKNGYPIKVWQLISGRRNEMLDCEVLNLAAFMVIKPPMERLAKLMAEKIKQDSGQQSKQQSDTPAPAPQETASNESKSIHRRIRRPRRYLTI